MRTGEADQVPGGASDWPAAPSLPAGRDCPPAVMRRGRRQPSGTWDQGTRLSGQLLEWCRRGSAFGLFTPHRFVMLSHFGAAEDLDMWVSI